MARPARKANHVFVKASALMGRLTTLGPRLGTINTRSAIPPPKQVDPYYTSSDHQQWRAAVINRAGGQCEYVNDAGVRCSKTEHRYRMFADHIVERRDGGDPLSLANGQCLCGAHHSLKTAQERALRRLK